MVDYHIFYHNIHFTLDNHIHDIPNVAFFERHGAAGWAAYETTCSMARDAGLLVIGDVKRGDIGSTAAAYARAFFGGTPWAEADSTCDAITVNPYLGTDSIEPFLQACQERGTGLFVLGSDGVAGQASASVGLGNILLSERRFADARSSWKRPMST